MYSYIIVYITVAIEKAKAKWESQGIVQTNVEEEIDIYAHTETIVPSDEEGIDVEWEEGEDNNTVPSQQEIEEMLVRRRKKVLVNDYHLLSIIILLQELLEKYTSEMLVQQSETSKALLGLT